MEKSWYPVAKECNSTFAHLCRIVYNGGMLSVKDQVWFDNQVKEVEEKLKAKKTKVVEDKPTNVISIQDRIREKAQECIGELEGQLDELIMSKFSTEVSPYAMMHGMEIKGVHTRHISEWFKKKRIQFDDVLHTDDAQVKEGWSNFTKPQMKKLIAYCDQVILDCNKVAGEAVKSRKPRKRKTKTPDQLVAKLKYLVEFPDLKLKSIAPKDIIGASQL